MQSVKCSLFYPPNLRKMELFWSDPPREPVADILTMLCIPQILASMASFEWIKKLSKKCLTHFRLFNGIFFSTKKNVHFISKKCNFVFVS